MSGSYVLSPLALADLSDIWDYSYSNWGADQADTYVLAILQPAKSWQKVAQAGKVQSRYARAIAST